MPRRALRPIARTFIADTLTPISAYAVLADTTPSVLLESVEGRDRIARYSFIGLDPLETLVITESPDMLARVRALVQRHEIAADHRLPYSGGVVVAFAYDAARSMEHLGSRPPADGTVPDAYCIVPGTWLIFDHFDHTVIVMGLADDGREAEVEARLDQYVAKLRDARMSFPGEVHPTAAVTQSLSKSDYLEKVALAKNLIREGDLYQIQLGIRFSANIAGEPFDFYRRIRARNPSPYMFYFNMPAGAIFGASPEFLVRLDGKRASVRPLAGTRSRGTTPALDHAIANELLADPKERAEHVMLVDLGRNDLGRVAKIGSVAVDELMIIERYSHVMHIVSNVTATLSEGADAVDVFAAAFPAGTVTGAPKIRAMQRIDELEPVARGFYAGSIAHFDFNGDMDSCITLRSVQVTESRAYWQASAGIVADSSPEAEYAEVFHKTAIIRSILGIEHSA